MGSNPTPTATTHNPARARCSHGRSQVGVGVNTGCKAMALVGRSTFVRPSNRGWGEPENGHPFADQGESLLFRLVDHAGLPNESVEEVDCQWLKHHESSCSCHGANGVAAEQQSGSHSGGKRTANRHEGVIAGEPNHFRIKGLNVQLGLRDASRRPLQCPIAIEAELPKIFVGSRH